MNNILHTFAAYFDHYYADELPLMASSNSCLLLCYCGYY